MARRGGFFVTHSSLHSPRLTARKVQSTGRLPMLSDTLLVDCTRPLAPRPRRHVEAPVPPLHLGGVRESSGVLTRGVVHGRVARPRVDEPAASCERSTPTQPSSERSAHREGV